MFPHDRRAQVKKILGGGGDKIIRRCAKGFPVALIWGGGGGNRRRRRLLYRFGSARFGSLRFGSVDSLIRFVSAEAKKTRFGTSSLVKAYPKLNVGYVGR